MRLPLDTTQWDWDDMEVGKMKRKVVGVLVVMLSLPGCSNDVEKPERERSLTLNTVMGTVVVQDVNRNLEQKEVTARVVGADIDAILQVASSGDGSQVHGVIAELTDVSGRLLFSFETLANDETGEVSYREATDQDYVALSMTADDERMRETYDANGDVAWFEYPMLSDEVQRHAINSYEHESPSTSLPADVVEYIAQADAFHAYYLPHSTSSIHGNPAGELLVQLLTAPDLSNLVVGAAPPPIVEMNARVQQVCGWFGVCATFFCRLGGGTNPVCFYCSAAALGCSIMMLGCQWFGC
jgi:hypothetical protein